MVLFFSHVDTSWECFADFCKAVHNVYGGRNALKVNEWHFQYAERLVTLSRTGSHHILPDERNSGWPLSGFLVAW